MQIINESSKRWNALLCHTCPVPSINRANACQYLRLNASISKSFLWFIKPRVRISAFCEKTNKDVVEPHIGCGECHPIPTLLK